MTYILLITISFFIHADRNTKESLKNQMAQAHQKFGQQFVEPFKKLDVLKIPLSDLRGFETASPPLALYIPKILPSPFYKNPNAKIQIWASSCAPCLAKLETTWRDPSNVWVNIDKSQKGIEKSLDWLRTKNIQIQAYHDYSRDISQQTGTRYPIPLEITLKNNKVEHIRFGWSSEKDLSSLL